MKINHVIGLVLLCALAPTSVGARPGTHEVPAPEVPTVVLERLGPDLVVERLVGRFVVTVAPDVDPRREAAAIARDHGGAATFTYVSALRGFAFVGSDAARASLLADPRVRAVEPDVVRRLAAHDRTKWRAHERRVRAPRAFHDGYRAAGTRVAVLDTGVAAHWAIPRIDRSSGAACAKGKGTQDLEGHGTAVAGVVARVARRTTIVPVRVFDHGADFTTIAKEICGFDHVTALNTNGDPSDDIDVVNLSFGGPGTCDEFRAYCRAISRSISSGAVYTVAAGNDRLNVRFDLPASHPRVITVSALAGDGRLAGFSNFGAKVDLTAPGTRIRAPQPGGSWTVVDGTSFSSPIVAAAAAVVRGQDPALTPRQVRAHLKWTGLCPDGRTNGSDGPCHKQGRWTGDRDGITEPLVNVWRAGRKA